MDHIQNINNIGNQLLNDINKAKSFLSSAKTWGVIDLFGGGLLSGIFKHSKVSESEKRIRGIQRNLAKFQNELQYINLNTNSISSFDMFMDLYFDSFFYDLFIQSKINDNIKKLNKLESQIKSILKEVNQI